MQFRDNEMGYGLVSRWLHWLMALAIFFMFGLGYWMMGLEYYSPYYRSAPDLHRSIGIVIAAALVFRFVWRLANPKPDDAELSPMERAAAKVVHWGFYPLILVIVISGYLISSSDGRAIDVFGLFSVPSLVTEKGLSDQAGYLHKVLAYFVMAAALLHAAASLKHHFWDRSGVLKRMVSGPPEE
ncbi:MAG TPA: cytochrome b [Hyphomicrobium sp.]|nr:cytochrome b [Hyphomicrobium sp.]